ncbi:cryptochrome/photolyase family protein [Ruegeria faecimaris]|uniref:cryptochrome/photolyase family protein n=1 Tax=Ruegeria faecimaris TaxID=686389 RepID=UPI00248F8484|nr:deoxyribodipyrimidine photo-lyase [Ruegeria faecimaris]
MGPKSPPIIMWFRQDLRLSDHPALSAASATGRPIIPVYLFDDLGQALGAAPKWRLGKGLEVFDRALAQLGSRLILRRGDALEVLQNLIKETGSTEVYWSRAYDPDTIARDTRIKAALTKLGVQPKSFSGHLLFEPWTVQTKTGTPFRVFTPMWRSVQKREVPFPHARPAALTPPKEWPHTDTLESWGLAAGMNRGASVCARYVQPGEDAAFKTLHRFLERLSGYPEARDQLAEDGTSGISEYLSLGEIGPRSVWHALQGAEMFGMSGTEAYLRQLVWREFAYHLMFHTPHLLSNNWKPEWDQFPWGQNASSPEIIAWKQARTGIPVVDAGLRQMYVTGRMHNRARMIVASYLTKHLMAHWKIGMGWFSDCLTDWDPASNAMGWQWVAGSGPDASPFFRIFNPEAQQKKYDPYCDYVRKWVAEGQSNPPSSALDYFEAIPCKWGLDPSAPYPNPVVGLAEGRARALSAYEGRKSR